MLTSDQLSNLNDNLCITLITYNRADCVKIILRDLSRSVLKDLSIIVLDNKSTDHTRSVIESFQNSLLNMVYIRNKVNLGLAGNLLKAYEVANRKYVWVLCDDDILVKKNIEHFVEIFLKRNSPVYYFQQRLNERDKKTSLIELFSNSTYQAFFGFSFLPSVIVDSSKMKEVIAEGYKTAATVYPHMFMYFKAFGLNTEVTLITKPLIRRGTAEVGLGMRLLPLLLTALDSLPTSKLKSVAVSFQPSTPLLQSFFLWLTPLARFAYIDMRRGEKLSKLLKWSIKSIELAPFFYKFVLISNLPVLLLYPILIQNKHTVAYRKV